MNCQHNSLLDMNLFLPSTIGIPERIQEAHCQSLAYNGQKLRIGFQNQTTFFSKIQFDATKNYICVAVELVIA